MKIDRLMGIITILLQTDKITASQLAARFEVSRRTINRDIEDLCRAGIPLITTQGYRGGISIAEGFAFQRSLFTGDELQALLAGLKGIDSVSATSHLTSLLEKLSTKKHQITADDIILIDLASHYQGPLTQKIDVIKDAIKGCCIIAFKYYYPKGEQTRSIQPYRLLFKWSSWYVFGYCLDRQDYRLFKLNRLWDLQVKAETFSPREIPADAMDFDGYFESDTIHLKALFSASEKYRLIEEYGIDCFSAQEDGSLLLERNFASYENMRQWVFSFGDSVEILAPESLRLDRIRQAKKILKGT